MRVHKFTDQREHSLFCSNCGAVVKHGISAQALREQEQTAACESCTRLLDQIAVNNEQIQELTEANEHALKELARNRHRQAIAVKNPTRLN